MKRELRVRITVAAQEVLAALEEASGERRGTIIDAILTDADPRELLRAIRAARKTNEAAARGFVGSEKR